MLFAGIAAGIVQMSLVSDEVPIDEIRTLPLKALEMRHDGGAGRVAEEQAGRALRGRILT